MITISSLIRAGGSVWTIAPDQTVLDALHLLAERDIGVLPVVDENGALVGIFSERDYARRVILLGRTSESTEISEVMTKNVQTVAPEDGVDQCMKIVVDKGFRHLPVVDNEELIAVVSANDLLAQVIRSREKQIGTLESLLTGAGEVT